MEFLKLRFYANKLENTDKNGNTLGLCKWPKPPPPTKLKI